MLRKMWTLFSCTDKTIYNRFVVRKENIINEKIAIDVQSKWIFC